MMRLPHRRKLDGDGLVPNPNHFDFELIDSRSEPDSDRLLVGPRLPVARGTVVASSPRAWYGSPMRWTVLPITCASLLACSSGDDSVDTGGDGALEESTGNGDASGDDHGHGHDDHGHDHDDHDDDRDGTTGGEPEDGSGDESSGAPVIDTWESWALPSFFEVYCNDCHPGASPRDFGQYEIVVANEEHIRCGVAPEALPDCHHHIEPAHLPIGDGPQPSDDERWRLVDWMQAGMPRD